MTDTLRDEKLLERIDCWYTSILVSESSFSYKMFPTINLSRNKYEFIISTKLKTIYYWPYCYSFCFGEEKEDIGRAVSVKGARDFTSTEIHIDQNIDINIQRKKPL